MSKHKKILAIQMFLFHACKTGMNQHQNGLFNYLNWPDLFAVHLNPFSTPWGLFEITIKLWFSDAEEMFTAQETR